MTEKRFKLSEPNGAYLIDNDRPYAHWINDDDKIIDLLNELDEKWVGEFSLRETLQLELQRVENENEQLKSKNRGLQSELQIFKEDVTHSNFMINKLAEENEQLKKENSVFEGKDAKHYQRWVNQIKKYVEEDNPDFTYDDDFIIKIALSYTLQSVRNGESLKRFQWDYKELKE